MNQINKKYKKLLNELKKIETSRKISREKGPLYYKNGKQTLRTNACKNRQILIHGILDILQVLENKVYNMFLKRYKNNNIQHDDLVKDIKLIGKLFHLNTL
jgi:hypothetical protein